MKNAFTKSVGGAIILHRKLLCKGDYYGFTRN